MPAVSNLTKSVYCTSPIAQMYLYSLAPELAGALSDLVGRPVGVEGHANHQGIGLPFADTLGHLGEAGIALRADRALGRGAAQHARTHGDAGALEPVIESQKGLEMRGDDGWSRLAAHACPASGDSIHDCRPSNPSARS